MTVVSSHRDMDNLTLTFVTEFDAPVEKVWDVWADPRKLEKWWGPPGYPATFQDYQFEVGGKALYFMTSPEGEKYYGAWEITKVDQPHTFGFTDGFADEHGTMSDDPAPTTCVVTIERAGEVTRMTALSTFATLADFEKTLEMGMEEGMTAAAGQIDALLA